MEKESTIIERANRWIRNSVSLKLFIITFLVLLLLIPTAMIKSIIYERQLLNEETTAEVSSKWANEQLVVGPILTIPLVYEYEREYKNNTKIEHETVTVQEYFHLLPSNLEIIGQVDPKKLTRGLYEVVVFNSKSSVSGSFDLKINPNKSGLKAIKWEEAFITIGISDLRGIKDEIKFKWGDKNLKVESGSNISSLISSGVTAIIPQLMADKDKEINFHFDLNLQGSKNLSYIPVGATTNVEMQSSWSSPSFDGSFLPDARNLSKEGFTASWKVLQLNRNFPQSWVGSNQGINLYESAFGVNFILGLDDYQKSMRSAKYAVMTIVLTFLIFFLVEVLHKRKIHPFQYTLVGLSLSLFYVLLISISEHTSFNMAFVISAIAIITMISLYSLSVFKSGKHSLLLVATLIGIYGFLFVTLQLTDYALLMGSLGLTVILGITMYFTRNINWYKLNIDSE